MKSPRRDKRALDYGRFMLVDAQTGDVVLGSGAGRYQADIDQVEAFLTGERSRAA